MQDAIVGALKKLGLEDPNNVLQRELNKLRPDNRRGKLARGQPVAKVRLPSFFSAHAR